MQHIPQSGGDDGKVCYWDLREAKSSTVLGGQGVGVEAMHSFNDGHEEQVVNSVAWHQHDRSLCASVGDDGAIVWYGIHDK